MPIIPWRLRYLLTCLGRTRDWRSALFFIARADVPVSRAARLRFALDAYRISAAIWCAHTEDEMFEVATAILKVPRSVQGIIAEAGCYKGGSTAKLSLLARLTGRRLVAYDSFEGLPDNDESGQTSILGETATFARGAYKGTYDEVVGNVGRCGDASVCRFAKGWFEDTMPHDSEPVVVAFVDVDLTTSTRTCLKYLFPRLARGGVLFSQDGHLPMVIDVLDDDAFWEREMGRAKPPMVGLRTRKLVQIRNDSR